MNGVGLFRLDGKVAALTGGGGVLASAIAGGLGAAGARVAVCDLVLEKAERTAAGLREKGVEARAYGMDALSKASLGAGCEAICRDFGGVDILVNAAGGNLPEASTNAERSFFDIPLPSLEKVVALNLFAGAILPAQVFGRKMVENADGGSIINISSMNAIRPLTRIPGYSAAKAAVSNFTQWLAVHVAQNYNRRLRVNAIAPGFFLTDQNRYLLTDEKTGEITERGRAILAHTPMGRYGEPEDLVGTAVWLASPASRFVTGIVVPVDGGFSVFSGV